jgi:hypothetical protein
LKIVVRYSSELQLLRYYPPLTEFDSVVYVCDAQTNSIKLLSILIIVQGSSGRLVHSIKLSLFIISKAALYETKTTNEAIELAAIAKLPLQSMNMKYVLKVTSLVH